MRRINKSNMGLSRCVVVLCSFCVVALAWNSLFLEINKYSGYELALLGSYNIVKSISGGLSLSPLNCTLSNNGKKDQGLFLCEGDSDSSFWWFRPTVVDAILNAGFSMVQGEYIPGAADAQNYVFVRK